MTKDPLSRFLTLALVIGCLTGCTKDKPGTDNLYDLSKDVHFTINVGGKTYTSYGYHRKDPAYPQYGEGQTVIPYAVKGPEGQDSLVLEFEVSSKTGIGDQSVGNCNLRIFLIKAGKDTTGKYERLWRMPNKTSYFTDDGSVAYLFDSTGLVFNVSYADFNLPGGPYAVGTFTCQLKRDNSSEPVPASGSFRLARPY